MSCLTCHNPLSRGAVFCIDCGTDQRSGRRLTKTHAETPKGWSETQVASALVGAGVLTHLLAAMLTETSLAATVVTLSVSVAIGVPLLLAAAVIVGNFLFQTSFGEVRSAVPKLAAVLLLPNGLGALCALLGPGGALIGYGVSLVAYYALLTWQFRMHLAEAWFFTLVAWLLQVFIVGALLTASG